MTSASIDGRPMQDYRLAFELGVPLEDLEATVLRFREQMPSIDFEVLTRNFGFDRAAESMTAIGASLGISPQKVSEAKNRGIRELEQLLKVSRAPSEILDWPTDAFFTTMRARSLEIRDGDVRRINNVILIEFGVTVDRKLVAPTLRRFLELATKKTLLLQPNFARKSLQSLQRMLATADLKLKA